MSKFKVVVVGNGMVGHHYVNTLAASNVEADITVIGGETRPAYDRVHLSEVFDGKEASELGLTTRDYYDELGVAAHFGDFVTAIDRDAKIVSTQGGQKFSYDKLVLATGSYAFVPPITGGDQAHCLSYRTIDDLAEIKASSKGKKIGVVVGGGLLGLECANALKNLGLEAHVVEFSPDLMNVQLDNGGSQMLRRKIEALDVSVHTNKATEKIIKGDKHRLKMQFSDDTELETDVIVYSAGIRPYDQLARDSGLKVGERGGIQIDYQCKTSDENIFAIGECAVLGDFIYGLVAPGYRMAEAAASQLSDDKHTFTGADMSTKLKLLGVDVGSIGDSKGLAGESRAFIFSDERDDVYKRLNVSNDGKRVLGATLVGDCSDYDTLLQYFLNQIELPENPEDLILPAGDRAAPSLGADALPMTASICSCHNVSKGDIVNAIDSGCLTVADVKGCTKAATGCGGCAALLKNVVDSELDARGLEVNTDLCEHFKHTREELFTIAQAAQITTFEQLISEHGSGQGCDICKPAVASIMASLWNDHILESDLVPLQDTNDTFMANMQKDGTYSVVPRVPAGEILPDQLIALGQVAKEYGLYSKITGGQRVDLFGARINDLPNIWAALIDAGFETGHAYAKALRTVKSCVGSTWCRYGVQDSVGQAIDLENRYKGLRMPHKLKMGVSGCTRECAEAQSKDVGVIATEHGWNLYVCGNGGMKPRHADLFATDLDAATLIKYIDRVLMLYVRTADRLQRTSVWLENLEGGLDYLKAVVIDDSLGICADLEKQMKHIINTYQCEWKTAINDKQKLKRFRQFVNSDGEDENVLFVEERGQIRPASKAEKQRSKLKAVGQ